MLLPSSSIHSTSPVSRHTAQQSADLYELIFNRHRASSFVITSNRAVDEWLGLFEDPVLGNSALDRLVFDVNYLCRFRRLFLPVHLLLLTPLLSQSCPVAGYVEFQDDRVMHDAVDGRRGGHGIGEDVLPLGEDQAVKRCSPRSLRISRSGARKVRKLRSRELSARAWFMTLK